MIKLMAVSLFYWSLVLLWVMGVRKLSQFLGDKMSPGLFQDFINGCLNY